MNKAHECLEETVCNCSSSRLNKSLLLFFFAIMAHFHCHIVCIKERLQKVNKWHALKGSIELYIYTGDI